MAALCEGCSINAVVRMTGVSKPTILKLLVDMGHVCLNFEDRMLRDLPCRNIEADELWGFVHCKAKRARTSKVTDRFIGSAWTWCAIDTKSKALISWLVGDRDQDHAKAFMHDLASRLASRPQLTTDALGIYQPAVKEAFNDLGCDYAILHKTYAASTDEPHHYSPPKCVGCYKEAVMGRPVRENVSTSRVERFNLSVRMHQRRWTRLTNGHSKKFENMESAFAVHSFYYNWIRKNMAHGKTPAQALGIADKEWTVDDMVGLLEDREQEAIEAGFLKRGPYGPRS